MTCVEAEMYVSALCDGESIPPDAAKHIRTCPVCHATLAEYGRIGTELRVSAAMETAVPPQLELPQRRRVFDFLWRRVPVPRFALAALLVAVVAAGLSVPLVRAQQSPRWFQFGYTLEPGGRISQYRVAKAGFDETGASMEFVNGALLATALRIRVESVSDDDVVLRCRAVPGKLQLRSDGGQTLQAPSEIRLDDVAAVHYKPGQQVAIAIDGGGTVYLKGDVYDQQPKTAFGSPLEPPSNQLVMRSPVLTSEGRLIVDLSGGSATAVPGTAVTVAAGNKGRFLFALAPFPDAVQGEIEWGQMTFTVNHSLFRVVAAAPLAGGDQPRPVWVRYDPTPVHDTSIGGVRLGE